VAYNPSGPTWTQVFSTPNPSYATVVPPTGGGGAKPPACELPDFNGDRAVTQADVDAISARFMQTPADRGWDAKFDVIPDQVVNVYDIFEVVLAVGESCP
jgi:hypothetical protein